MSQPIFTFDIAGRSYKAARLNAMTQGHLLKRVMPIIPPLIPLFQSIAQRKGDVNALSSLAQPFADALGNMTDEASDFVFSTCLASVQMDQNGHWHHIWNKGAKTMQFDELNDLGVILPIVVRLLQENLGPFFQGILTSQGIPEESPTTE